MHSITDRWTDDSMMSTDNHYKWPIKPKQTTVVTIAYLFPV